MLVNYKELPVGPIIVATLFFLIFLIGLPLWYLNHYGLPQHQAGKIIVAPAMGVYCLFLVVRTLRFNARVRVNPRALQWNSQGISLWQGDRAQTVPWSRVSRVTYRPGRNRTDVSFLKIATADGDGREQNWSFASRRLDLAGETMQGLAKRVEEARSQISRPVEKAAA